MVFFPAAVRERTQDRPLEHLLQIHIYILYSPFGDSHWILEFRRPRNAAEDKHKISWFIFIHSINFRENVLGVAGIENVADMFQVVVVSLGKGRT